MFKKINAYRVLKGVPELKWQERNAEIACRQAWYNAYNDVPRLSTHAIWQIGTSGGTATGTAEIPNSALRNWQNAAGHDANLRDEILMYAGVAIVEIYKNGKTYKYVAIVSFDPEWGPLPDPGIQK